MHRCFRHHEETTPVIKFHIADKGTLYSGPPDLTHPVPPEVLWIDICSPTKGEEAELEKALGLDIPTREEISEIEQTSRLYRSNGLLYMTAGFRQVSRQNALKPQRLVPHGWGGATISGGLARELTEPTECV